MYNGAIAKDDNLEHVPIEISQMIIDKENLEQRYMYLSIRRN